MSIVELSERIVFEPIGGDSSDETFAMTGARKAIVPTTDSGTFIVESDGSGSGNGVSAIVSSLVDESIYLDDILNSMRIYIAYALFAFSLILVVYAAYRVRTVHCASVYGSSATNQQEKTACHRSALLRNRRGRAVPSSAAAIRKPS